MDILVAFEFLVGGIGIVLCTQWILDWREKQIGITQQVVEGLVEVAEKLYTGKGRGKEKLAWVVGVVFSEAAKIGITFDQERVTEIVDAYVEEVFNS